MNDLASLQALRKPFVEEHPLTLLLVDDQGLVAESIKEMISSEEEIRFHYCQRASEAIEMANAVNPTVILQDLMMPEVDGLTLVRYFRANHKTQDVPLIVLSAKEESKIKAEAFACGANDYMVKLPQKEELLARIYYHSRGYVGLLQRNEAFSKLEKTQKALQEELREAAEYVKQLLPEPLSGKIEVDWRFIPSRQLGGDGFGYRWLENGRLIFYLLDVCGHGVGAALFSSSIMNVLNQGALPDADFNNPKEVLASLNRAYPMDRHNQMFFTLWYGVYHPEAQSLVYSSGGHPPALLRRPDQALLELSTSGLVLGAAQDSAYENGSCQVSVKDRIYLFSDGVFEIQREDGSILSYEEFKEKLSAETSLEIEEIVAFCKRENSGEFFADDFSLLSIRFSDS